MFFGRAAYKSGSGTKRLKFHYTIPQNYPLNSELRVTGFDIRNGEIDGINMSALRDYYFPELQINPLPQDTRISNYVLNIDDLVTGPTEMQTGCFPTLSMYDIQLQDTSLDNRHKIVFKQNSSLAYDPTYHYCLISSSVGHSTPGRYYFEYRRRLGGIYGTAEQVVIVRKGNNVTLIKGGTYYGHPTFTGGMIEITQEFVKWWPDLLNNPVTVGQYNIVGAMPIVYFGVLLAGSGGPSGDEYIIYDINVRQTHFVNQIPDRCITWLD